MAAVVDIPFRKPGPPFDCARHGRAWQDVPPAPRQQRLFASGEAALSECLKALFPGVPADAINRFRVFRKSFERCCGRLEYQGRHAPQRTHRRRAAAQAESSTEAEIELFSRASTADIDRAQELVAERNRLRAVPTSGKALESGAPTLSSPRT